MPDILYAVWYSVYCLAHCMLLGKRYVVRHIVYCLTYGMILDIGMLLDEYDVWHYMLLGIVVAAWHMIFWLSVRCLTYVMLLVYAAKYMIFHMSFPDNGNGLRYDIWCRVYCLECAILLCRIILILKMLLTYTWNTSNNCMQLVKENVYKIVAVKQQSI